MAVAVQRGNALAMLTGYTRRGDRSRGGLFVLDGEGDVREMGKRPEASEVC